ncbi:MAG: hypothetical protein GXW85_08740 [Clostridia bacterium]|nr:hypothetical protein [Clostridia bacterium]
MSLDGIAIRALVDELEPLLIGGRVDRIQQPDSNSIVITIRQPGKNYRLFLTINPQNPRFNLTESSKANPQQPPLFCMVLRKHLEVTKIIEIKQHGLERVVHFIFEGFDELGNKVKRILIGEFMGKHSNLILIKNEDQSILDSIKRLTNKINQYREVLPGVIYSPPPPQEKLGLEQISEETLISTLLNLLPNKKSIKLYCK